MAESPNPLELIPEYALGVLDEDQRVQVEALLTNSADARAELAAYEAMLVGLTVLTTPAQKAPATLTADFAARLRAESSAAQPGAATTEPPQVTVPGQKLPIARPVLVPPIGSGVEPFARQRSMRRALLTTLFAAAAVLLLVLAATTISGGLLNPGTLFPTSDLAQRQINEILADPGVQRYAVQFTLEGSKAGGAIYANRDNKMAVLEVAQLDPAPDGKDYQVWLLADGVPRSAGVFNVQTMQYPTRVLISTDDPFTAYQVLALSVEPTGGSKQPTTQPFATAKLE